jgi:uncharacterized lipoprotein YddW (UPF0748 family)
LTVTFYRKAFEEIMNKILTQVALLAATTCLPFVAAAHPSKNIGYDLTTPSPEPAEIQSPPREFRAAWVATVANIDWPSKSTLTTEQQKAEAIAILDRCEELNMNAVIFQGRPAADAMYKSNFEPWSFFLTNKMGTPPNPYYDPLEFWVEEAHKRGLELHVWFNPYRALHSNQVNRGGEVSDDSIVKTRPDLARRLSSTRTVTVNGKEEERETVWYWMDPAHPDTRQRSIDVVMDVVSRYDIDGVHFDDYFYPYPSYNGGRDFPDDDLWEKYQANGGTLSRGDWRRDAVNMFVERLYGEIKAEKPHVKFGISPFGIYRPGHPETIQGFDQYDQLYADARLWLQEGWVDYYTPQLYWPIAQIPQSYPILLNWWHDNNILKRNLWPGTSIGRASRDNAEQGSKEILNQIQINRAMLGDTGGIVMFSMKVLMSDKAPLADDLASGPFKTQALVPPSPWIENTPPPKPMANVSKTGDEITISIRPGQGEESFLYVVYTETEGSWNYQILPSTETELTVKSGGTREVTRTTNQGLNVETRTVPVPEITSVAVSAIDRVGNESDRHVINVSGN